MKKILLALLLVAFTTQAAEVVGTLNITRMVKVTSGEITDGANVTWLDAKQNQPVNNLQGVRTLKRSMAEVHFNDKSILRINERTDLVIQQSRDMRNINLKEGAVWIQVAKGSKTVVHTPTATATAKGTIFIVTVKPDGSTQITVLEGVVEVTGNADNIPATDVSAGETTSVTVISVPDTPGQGKTQIFKSVIPTAQLPIELGGTEQGWTSTLSTVVNGTQVTSGTDVGQGISQDTQENNNADTSSPIIIIDGFIIDPAIRQTFMDIMRLKVAPVVKNALATGGTLETYTAANANADMSVLYGLTSDQLKIINKLLDINDVPYLMDVMVKNGAAVNIGIDWGTTLTRQSIIIPGSNTAPVNSALSFRLIDKNKSSLAIVGIGAIASFLANGFDWRTEVNGKDGTTIKQYVRPDFTGNLFAFSGDPSFAGARSIITGRLGKSIYTVESNYLIVTGVKSSQKFDSVALFEHPVNDNWSAFIGRKRFQAGPVIRNLNSTQLIFDRYTGAGITYKNNKIKGEAAWLYDSNPVGTGAERGATAHVTAEISGAVIGVNYLHAGQVTPGNGYTASLAAPLITNYLEGYTEVGKGVDGSKLETYGLYFPSIYQNYDVDLFIEYGSHVGIGSAYSLCASYVVDNAVDLRFYTDLKTNGKININGGLIWKFDIIGNKKKR